MKTSGGIRVGAVKRSHRRIMGWLRDGARVWSPARRRRAYVCLPEGHRDARLEGRVGAVRVLRSTLEEMEEAGLLETDSAGAEYADTCWRLAGPGDRGPAW